MISFSSEEITFTYAENQHLTTTLAIRNNTTSKHLYYKFKVSRQKYYMVKPDKSHVAPNESVVVHISIHKEGIPQSNSDQFQLQFIFFDTPQKENYTEMFKQGASYETKKFLITVSGGRHAPSLKSSLVGAHRPVESVLSQPPVSDPKTVLFSKLEQKEQRIRELESEIQNYQGMNIGQGSMSKAKGSSKSVIIMGVLGIVFGYVAGLFLQ